MKIIRQMFFILWAITERRYVPGGNRIGISFGFHIQCVAWNPFAITTTYAWHYSGLL